MKKTFWIDVVFWLHLPIVILWFGLFLVPTSLWPLRITFHFWYIVSIMIIQLLWSLTIFRRFDIICPLTTLMQSLRGHKLNNDQNYDHSYIAELMQKLKLKVKYKGVNIVLLITLILIFLQYFFFN
ncbi:hypothetical protein COY27_02835 [Candidatus Woesearchaeota archaeon CG_4_10_14_0_2_um_filter_33_13]|nr:MAG: hypothetical protein COY27_02835 [Candidatus Woesearchaeota archaeon CG_4_10_14_0_2_um_filter_33_13]